MSYQDTLKKIQQNRFSTHVRLTFYHMWRYIDDTFMIWPKNSEELYSVLVALDSCHPATKFMPATSVTLISFLDVTVNKDKNGQLHTDLCTNPNRSHPYLEVTLHSTPRTIDAMRKNQYMFTKSTPNNFYPTTTIKQTLATT